MGKKNFLLVVLFLLIVTGCRKTEGLNNTIIQDNNDKTYYTTMKRDLLCLMMAYPNCIVGVEKDKDSKVYIIMKSGNRILYDDKKEKNFSQKLQSPDLQDMLEQNYPLGKIDKLMEENFDPGRIRVYSILKEVYGSNKKNIESNLENVNMGYKNYPFNEKNDAAENLRAALKELNSIAKNNWRINSNLYPSSGTYNYRVISGTNRLSPHSFGIAIDLKRDKRDYWKWATREAGEARLKEYPEEIVKTLEKYNFVWGGKWSHFDILHFEYRPEIILKARYFGNGSVSDRPWYKGVPYEDEGIKKLITIIDNELD